jgi:hypothetical protein
MEKFKLKLKENIKDSMRLRFKSTVRKKVIDDWIERNGIDKDRILGFLDNVILNLYNIVWCPTDTSEEAESYEEKMVMQIDHIREQYGDVLDKYPLEILYYVGCVNMAGQIFKDKIFEQLFQNPYNGRFATKYEDILVDWLGVKTMFNR